jgi:hypothetical protein
VGNILIDISKFTQNLHDENRCVFSDIKGKAVPLQACKALMESGG